jgi:hypothetical protein
VYDAAAADARMLVTAEAMRRDPLATLAEVHRFLGVDPGASEARGEGVEAAIDVSAWRADLPAWVGPAAWVKRRWPGVVARAGR